jgi:glycosyltransferase involved in cell wall biosynthesis
LDNKPGKGRKRVAIVYPFTNLDSVPGLYNAAILLAEHGYWVDIFTHFSDVHLRPTFASERIEVLPAYIPPRRERARRWRLMPGRAYWALHLLTRHQQAPYICVIGVNPEGLTRAQSITRWIKVPLIYYSLELLLSYELITEQERIQKAQEIELSRLAAFVIIQDEERAKLLIQDNDLSLNRVLCVPNAPLGPSHFQRSDYLRQKFNLSPDVKIILHTGSVGAWAGTHYLMRSTHDWPENWVLICHTRYRETGFLPEYLAALQYIAKPGRVIFSTEPLPQQEYPALVQSADVGIVYYCPTPGSVYTQDNIRYIGLSSGKLAYYLQTGVPVVVNNIPSLRRLASTYQCGEVIEDPATTRQAIEHILANYATYSQGANACFKQEFDFACKFERVLQALEQM